MASVQRTNDRGGAPETPRELRISTPNWRHFARSRINTTHTQAMSEIPPETGSSRSQIPIAPANGFLPSLAQMMGWAELFQTTTTNTVASVQPRRNSNAGILRLDPARGIPAEREYVSMSQEEDLLNLAHAVLVRDRATSDREHDGSSLHEAGYRPSARLALENAANVLYNNRTELLSHTDEYEFTRSATDRRRRRADAINRYRLEQTGVSDLVEENQVDFWHEVSFGEGVPTARIEQARRIRLSELSDTQRFALAIQMSEAEPHPPASSPMPTGTQHNAHQTTLMREVDFALEPTSSSPSTVTTAPLVPVGPVSATSTTIHTAGQGTNPSKNTQAMCCVCLEAPPTVVVLPCCHLCMCADCSNQFANVGGKSCPTCRLKIGRLLKTFG
jgi:hypothetical protein